MKQMVRRLAKAAAVGLAATTALSAAGPALAAGAPTTDVPCRPAALAAALAGAASNETLRLALNWALFGLWEKGRFTDLWLRYFPISPF